MEPAASSGSSWDISRFLRSAQQDWMREEMGCKGCPGRGSLRDTVKPRPHGPGKGVSLQESSFCPGYAAFKPHPVMTDGDSSPQDPGPCDSAVPVPGTVSSAGPLRGSQAGGHAQRAPSASAGRPADCPVPRHRGRTGRVWRCLAGEKGS